MGKVCKPGKILETDREPYLIIVTLLSGEKKFKKSMSGSELPIREFPGTKKISAHPITPL
jgi:hypothetical protein